MLHLEPNDDYADIIIRAGLFYEIPTSLCAKATVSFLKESGCKIRMLPEDIELLLNKCMRLFQFLSGPDPLDGELMANFLLNLQTYMVSISAEGRPRSEVDWQVLSTAVDKDKKRLVSDLTISRIKKYFSRLKENNRIIISAETIYHFILPIVLITAKNGDEYKVYTQDLMSSASYEIAAMPDIKVLKLLELFCLVSIQAKLFHNKDDLQRVYCKYFFHAFESELPPLAFYPQPRAKTKEKKKGDSGFVLNRSDIKNLSRGIAEHQALINLANEIRKLNMKVKCNSEFLQVISRLNVFDVEPLILMQWVEEIKQDAALSVTYQGEFVALFTEFEKQLNNQVKLICADKKEQHFEKTIVWFVAQLKGFLFSPYWRYGDSVSGTSKSIKDMIFKYQALFKRPLLHLDLYKEARAIAQVELLSPELPADDNFYSRPFDLHAAICFASVEYLSNILESEKYIEQFVNIFLKHMQWHFRPETKELLIIDQALACYRELLNVPQSTQMFYRQAVGVAKREFAHIKSLSIGSDDVRNLHEGILQCDKTMLKGLDDFKKSAFCFVEALQAFLNQPLWKSLDSSNDDEHAIKSSFMHYQAIFENGLSSQRIFNQLTWIAERELRLTAEARINPNPFFSIKIVNDLVMLHNAIYNREIAVLDNLSTIWRNNIQNRRAGKEDVKIAASSPPIALMY